MSPARARGQRVDLSVLAGEPDLDDGRHYPATAGGTRPIPLDQLALNPFNKRVLAARPENITELAESMRTNGLLQPCAVITRAAFRRIFPDDDHHLERGAAFVHVTGARRHTAARQLGWPTLEVIVNDELAATPRRFLSATAAENLDRQDFDPVEEAEQVQLQVTAAGSGQAAAEDLHRSPGWVSQRLNLLKLVPEIQAALRAGDIPLREVRTLHTLDEAAQLAAFHRFTAVNRGIADAATTTVSKRSADGEPRPSPVARALRRLGGTPDRIAMTLRTELDPDELTLLIQHLTTAAEQPSHR